MIGGRRIAVVIPAFRVEKEIGGVLDRMPPWVDTVHVVDDESPDRTSEVVRGRGEPRVRLVRHDRNQGVGGAMATGFAAALAEGAEILVKCDGDGQMDPADIASLVKPLLEGRAEYAKGCRFHHGDELRTMPRLRLAGNVGLTLLTKLASGYWHVLDPQNGFVAVSAPVLRRIPLGKLSRGYFFENDMLIRLNAVEARVADVPLPARYGDEPSSLRPGRILFGFPPRLLAGFARRMFWRYAFYDVSPILPLFLCGLALFTFGTLFGAYHWLDSLRLGRATPAGTIMVAAVPFLLGFQLLLQAVMLDIQGSPRPAPPLPQAPGADGRAAAEPADTVSAR